LANLISGLGGDAGFGENALTRNDDGYSDFIDVTAVFENGLNFFGHTYNGFYINTNGGITFNYGRSTFTPDAITSLTSNPEISAYYADVDTRGGPGGVSPGGSSTGTNLVYWDVDAANNTFTITWDDVGYYDTETDKLNAFQIVLTDLSAQPGSSAGDFRIEFRYEDINWTTGSASGGSGGLGGSVARAGFSAGQGDPSSFFELPQSGDQAAMLALETTLGNTGIAGLWRFDVSSGDVHPVVSVESTTGAAREGTGTNNPFTFTVTRSGDISQALTVDYIVTSPGGPNGADPDDLVGGLPETGRTGSVTFAVGQSLATIVLNAVGDSAPEPNESFIVTLTGTSQPDVTFGNPQAVATIQNDDGLGPTIPADWRNGWTFGDPHLTTLDGLQYDFQAVGEFIFAESTAGAPLTIQIRTEAAGPVVSATTAIATKMGSDRVTYDVHTNNLAVNGISVSIDPNVGHIDVGGGKIYLSPEGVYQIVYPDNHTYFFFADQGDFLDINLALDPIRAGQVRGLVGDFNGSTSNDFALRNGTVLGDTLSYTDLYGSYANSWRITQSESLLDYGAGQSTATFTNTSFPSQQITLDQFPIELVNAAMARALAAGITNPALQQSAVLDFLLTGDSAYIDGTSLVTAPTSTATATGAPTADIVGVGAAVLEWDERNAGTTTVEVTFYRSNATGTATLNYVVENIETNAADFAGGALPSGLVTFADGELTKTVSIGIAADTVAEFDERFRVKVTAASGGSVIAGSQVELTLKNDDGTPPATISMTGPATVLEGTGAFGAATQIVYTLTRAGDTTGTTTVNLVATGTGATPANGADFVGGALPNGVVVFLPGQQTKTYVVNLSAEAAFEGNETFSLALGTITGGGASATNSVQTTIVDDDTINEILYGTLGPDFINALDGNDTVNGLAGDDTILGGKGVDILNGDDGNDILQGGAGKDTLKGGAGLDVADYSDKKKVVDVAIAKSTTVEVNGKVEDKIKGVEGIFGGSAADQLTGDGKANLFRGGGGKDSIDGGKGLDTIDYSDKTKAVEIKLDGSNQITVKVAGKAEDSIKAFENAIGGSAGDKLMGDGEANGLGGGGGNDTISGGAGKDTVVGDAGKDSLDGGSGNDLIWGGLGKDRLTGGDDKDAFLFDVAPIKGNVDTITDFSVGEDKIWLDHDVFAEAGGLGKLAKAAFATNAAGQAKDALDRIIYETDTGKLFYDADGNGAGARVQIAVVADHPLLTHTSFLIV
jgi:Ca2+-binding RTX toxin-like protein